MTKSERDFMRSLSAVVERYARQLARLKAIQRGDIKVRRIWVEPFTVKKHRVKGHYRWV